MPLPDPDMSEFTTPEIIEELRGREDLERVMDEMTIAQIIDYLIFRESENVTLFESMILSMLLIRIEVLEKKVANLETRDNVGTELLKLLDKNTNGPRPKGSDSHAIQRSDPAPTRA